MQVRIHTTAQGMTVEVAGPKRSIAQDVARAVVEAASSALRLPVCTETGEAWGGGWLTTTTVASSSTDMDHRFAEVQASRAARELGVPCKAVFQW